jgi:cell division protein ZapA (FtsZ GTPase activity inhibitor)
LKKIKTDQLTPLEALNILDELKKKAEKEEWMSASKIQVKVKV